MIVRIKEEAPTPSGLSKGRDYDVLALTLYDDGRIDVRVPCDDDNLPALYSLLDLDIVDGSISNGWCVIKKASGAIELLPKEWSYPEFWTRFFDGDDDAVEAFQLYLQKSGSAESPSS